MPRRRTHQRLRRTGHDQLSSNSVLPRTSHRNHPTDGSSHLRARRSQVHVVTTASLRAHFAEQSEEFAPEVILVSTDGPAQLLLEVALRNASARVVYLARATLAVPFGPDCAFPSGSQTERDTRLRRRNQRQPVHVVDLRREAGYPLSAPLLAELGGVAEHGGKAILLLNRRGVAPALHCRACGATLRCRTATSRSSSTATASCAATTAATRSRRRRRARPAARPTSRGSARARRSSSASCERELPELELIRLDADAVAQPEALAARSSVRRRGPRRAPRHADGRQGPPLLGRRARRRRRRRHGARRCPTSAPRSGPFSCSRSSPGAAAATRPGASRADVPAGRARRSSTPRATTSRASSTSELERRRALGYPPFRTSCASSSPGRSPTRRLARSRSSRPGSTTATCSGRRRCCGCAAATARSSSAKTDRRAPRRAGRAPALGRGAGDAPRRADRRSSTSTRRRSEEAPDGQRDRRWQTQSVRAGGRGRRDHRRGGGVRDVERRRLSARARALAADRDVNPLRAGAAAPPAVCGNFPRPRPTYYLASVGGPLPYMQRLRQIEDEIEAHLARLDRGVRGGAAGTWAETLRAGTSAR